MYLFVFTYPIFIVLLYSTLNIASYKLVLKEYKKAMFFSILPFPFIALILRVGRSSIVANLGRDVVFFYFIETTLLPMLFFFYMVFIQKKTFTFDQKNENEIDENIIVKVISITIVCYFLFMLTYIIMNNVYTTWIDIIILPLVQMAILQVIMFSFMDFFYRLSDTYTTKKIFILLAYYLMLILASGIIGSVSIFFSLLNKYYIAGALFLIVFCASAFLILKTSFYKKTKPFISI